MFGPVIERWLPSFHITIRLVDAPYSESSLTLITINQIGSYSFGGRSDGKLAHHRQNIALEDFGLPIQGNCCHELWKLLLRGASKRYCNVMNKSLLCRQVPKMSREWILGSFALENSWGVTYFVHVFLLHQFPVVPLLYEANFILLALAESWDECTEQIHIETTQFWKMQFITRHATMDWSAVWVAQCLPLIQTIQPVAAYPWLRVRLATRIWRIIKRQYLFLIQ